MRDYPRFDYLDVKVTKYQKVYDPSTVYRELMLVIGGDVQIIPADVQILPADWAPGMIGLVPLFESRKFAEEFAREHDAAGRQITEFIIPVEEEEAQDGR
jgi:hypothetical protein